MLVSGDSSTVVDAGRHTAPAALWVCDTATWQTRLVPVGDLAWVAVRPGSEGLFAVEHHQRDGIIAVSARRLAAPEEIIATVARSDDGWVYHGDMQVWNALPHAYREEYALLLLDPATESVTRQACTWFTPQAYDWGYQAIFDVAEVPGSALLLVSVARDSLPVLHDPATGRAIGRVRLADRRGNATLRFRRTTPELWADDYDTLIKLSVPDRVVRATMQLQPAGALEVQGRVLPAPQFIGEFVFDRDESVCAVARPYSGDVVLLDTATFRVTHRVVTGGQPLGVALLDDGIAVARDWKSGELLRGGPREPWVI